MKVHKATMSLLRKESEDAHGSPTNQILLGTLFGGSAHWSYLPPSQRVYFHAGEAGSIGFLRVRVLNSGHDESLGLGACDRFSAQTEPTLQFPIRKVGFSGFSVPQPMSSLQQFYPTRLSVSFTSSRRLLDIPTNFLTAVYINGALQVDPRKIARAYSQSWLCSSFESFFPAGPGGLGPFFIAGFDILVLVPDVMAIVEGAQDAAEGTESIGAAPWILAPGSCARKLSMQVSSERHEPVVCFAWFASFAYSGWVQSSSRSRTWPSVKIAAPLLSATTLEPQRIASEIPTPRLP